MPDTYESAEWPPRAGLTDPVLTVRRLGRLGALTGRVAARADCALVLSTAKGGYEVFLPPRRPGRGELAGRGYQAAFEVDLRIHHLQLTAYLPGLDDIGGFETEVDVDWRVSAADRVVRSGIRDVPALLIPRIQQRMRAVARSFPTDLSGPVEAAVQQTLEAPTAEAEGLHVTCTVRLTLDPAAQAHKDRMRSYGFDTEAHPLARRKAQEDSDVLAQKADFYRYHLDHGGVAAWALQLAAHPDDLPTALDHLRTEQQDLVRNQIELVEKLLDRSHFEEFQLEDSTRATLEAITSILRRSAGGPPAPPLSSHHHLPPQR
ncbi:hypothetical protein AB0D08_14180 [Kitasatospora sp. NPDC048540]|uniref:hypothetical protein n=1 Tax=unclassified Kitasatospora TaxID=2633591 RepID=UPI00068FE79C|nr:hypothetical protein [Kitasatospora sp. MBT63]